MPGLRLAVEPPIEGNPRVAASLPTFSPASHRRTRNRCVRFLGRDVTGPRSAARQRESGRHGKGPEINCARCCDWFLSGFSWSPICAPDLDALRLPLFQMLTPVRCQCQSHLRHARTVREGREGYAARVLSPPQNILHPTWTSCSSVHESKECILALLIRASGLDIPIRHFRKNLGGAAAGVWGWESNRSPKGWMPSRDKQDGGREEASSFER